MIARRIAIALGLLAIAGCDSLPRDPGGTLARVAAEQRFAVGLVAAGGEPRDVAEERALLGVVVRATGARPAIEEGAAEPLLARLEAGELDLVLGRFAEPSPWTKRVNLSKPLRDAPGGDDALQLAVATAHGENRWIMLVDRAVAEVAR